MAAAIYKRFSTPSAVAVKPQLPGATKYSLDQPVTGYDPDRPFYGPLFLYALEKLEQGMQNSWKVQAQWSQSGLELLFETRGVFHTIEAPSHFYVFDENNIFYGDFLASDFDQLRARFGEKFRFKFDDKFFSEIPLSVTVKSTIPDNPAYPSPQYAYYVLRVPSQIISGYQRHSLDQLEQAHDDQPNANSPYHYRWHSDLFMHAYLRARYGECDLGKPVVGYSDLAMAQAFQRLHPNSAELRSAYVRYSPVVPSPLLQQLTGALEVWIADDAAQYTGSFKVRGATNKLMAELIYQAQVQAQNGNPIDAVNQETGSEAASHGNHAQGVRWAANQLGLEHTILVLPLHGQTQKNKIRKCLELGAVVILHGSNLYDATELAQNINHEGLLACIKDFSCGTGTISDDEIDQFIRAGKTLVLFGDPNNKDLTADAVTIKLKQYPAQSIFVHAYDDPLVSVGQATQSMELLAWLPHLIDSSFVYAVAAGGLGKLAGDATYLSRWNQNVRVVGVNRQEVPALARSLKAGRFSVQAEEYQRPETNTPSDGNDVPLLGEDNFTQVKSLGARVKAVLVTEVEIYEAIVFAVSHPWYDGQTKQIEGAPAGVLAAVLNGSLGAIANQPLVISITGKNIDEETMATAFAHKGWVAEDPKFYEFVTKFRRELRQSKWLSETRLALFNDILADPFSLIGLRFLHNDPEYGFELRQRLLRILWLGLIGPKTIFNLAKRFLLPKEFDQVGILSPGEMETARGEYHVIDLRSAGVRKVMPEIGSGIEISADDSAEFDHVLSRLSKDKLIVFIADDSMTTLRAAQKARRMGFAEVAVLKGQAVSLSAIRFINVMRHVEGWTSSVHSEHTSVFQDPQGREFHVWATNEGELTIRLVRGVASDLYASFNQSVVERALHQFKSVRFIQSDGSKLNVFRRDELARDLGLSNLHQEGEARTYRDKQGRLFFLASDMRGRYFHFDIEDLAEGGRVLHLVQILSHPRAPEMMFPEHLLSRLRQFFITRSNIDEVRLHFTTEANGEDYGHYPKPQIFRRADFATNGPVHRGDDILYVMMGLGFTPLLDEIDSTYLRLFSLPDGTKRFVVEMKPRSAVLPRLVPFVSAHYQLLTDESKPRMVLFVGNGETAPRALLEANLQKLIRGEFVAMISNHKELEPLAREYGVLFIHIPVEGKDETSRQTHRENVFSALKKLDANTLILARYMQRISPELIAHFGMQNVISVHHGLLPAFAGGRPYAQAAQTGVEIIGATAHFVTADIDAGPIIAQEGERVSSTGATVKDYSALGREHEARALVRAVQLHGMRRLGVVGESARGAQVVDILNLAIQLQESTKPGELHIHQLGDVCDAEGVLSKNDLLGIFKDGLPISGNLDRMKSIDRMRFTDSRGREIIIAVEDGEIVSSGSVTSTERPEAILQNSLTVKPNQTEARREHVASMAKNISGADLPRFSFRPSATTQTIPREQSVLGKPARLVGLHRVQRVTPGGLTARVTNAMSRWRRPR